MRFILPLLLALFASGVAVAADDYVVHATDVSDRKAVIATVEPAHQLVARPHRRNSGFARRQEGVTIGAGAQIALVADESLSSRCRRWTPASPRSNRSATRPGRTTIAYPNWRSGVSTQTQLDQAKTNLDVAERNLSAIRSDRDVVARSRRRKALSSRPVPAAFLQCPCPSAVVLAGETIATLSQEKFILRVELPERHARFLRAVQCLSVRAGCRTRVRPTRGRCAGSSIPKSRTGGSCGCRSLRSRRLFRRRADPRLYRTGRARTIIVPAAYCLSARGREYVRLASGD